MNEWDEREHSESDAIADAVRTYPLAPTPPGLMQAIMARVYATAPAPRFGLKWIDLALGLFSASMIGLVWFLWEWLPNWQTLPNLPDWTNALIPTNLGLTNQQDVLFLGIGMGGGLFALGVCLVIALVVLVPRPVIRLEPVSR